MDERLEPIRETLKSFIPGITDEIIEHITQMSEITELKKGEILVHIGDIPKKISIIISGLIRSYYIDLNGNDVTRYFMDKNSFCCSEVLFTNEKSTSCYEALEDCTLLCIDAAGLKALMHSDINCMKVYIGFLENGLEYKIERETSFLLKSATERYIDFKKMYPNIEERLNQSHIASYLGVTPVSLSRIRRTIKEEN
jgi:CRP-like cAMP-binding protein